MVFLFPSTNTNRMKPPKDFSPYEISLYYELRACGDSHGCAIDAVMGERLARRLFK